MAHGTVISGPKPVLRGWCEPAPETTNIQRRGRDLAGRALLARI